jgi:hypothetical protein
MKDGRKLFISKQTLKEIDDSSIVRQNHAADLEAVLAFEQFPKSKTSENIADWLIKSHLRGGLNPEYILCHATDGASNAVGSAMEFQAITSAVRQSAIRQYVCLAHQVNRSAKFASGMGDFRITRNEELSNVLRKTHEINSRIFRNESRLKILFAVQNEKKR